MIDPLPHISNPPSQAKRIVIIGCAGSGKTTLAFKLKELLGLPLYHLDEYYWKPNWTRSIPEEFTQIHTELCNNPTWIMEGSYMQWLEPRFAAADVIIFLDIPRRICMWRVIKRMIINYGKDIPGNPKDCPQQLSWEFLKWVWTFNARYRHIILEMNAEQEKHKPVYILRSKRDIADLLIKYRGG